MRQMWLNSTREGGGTGEYRRACCEIITLRGLGWMEVFCVWKVEAREVESEKDCHCSGTYTSSELLGEKPVLAIHAEARDLEDTKPAGSTSAPPPGARVGGPSNKNWGIWNWSAGVAANGSRAEPNEEG
jgi:hypothetical protein